MAAIFNFFNRRGEQKAAEGGPGHRRRSDDVTNVRLEMMVRGPGAHVVWSISKRQSANTVSLRSLFLERTVTTKTRIPRWSLREYRRILLSTRALMTSR